MRHNKTIIKLGRDAPPYPESTFIVGFPKYISRDTLSLSLKYKSGPPNSQNLRHHISLHKSTHSLKYKFESSKSSKS